METGVFVLWILSGVALIVTLVLWVAFEFTERWRKLPHFFWNGVGNQYAFCSSSDFDVAKKMGSFIKTPNGRNLILVQNTFHFDDRYVEDRRIDQYFHPCVLNMELFVPFASKSISIPEGTEFLAPKELNIDLVRSKKEQNKNRFWRMRFAHHHDDIVSLLSVSMFFFFFLFIPATIGQMILNDRANDEKVVTVYLTNENGQVYDVRSKYKDRYKMLVHGVSDPYKILWGGTVRDVQVLSSNMYRVCVVSRGEDVLCGFAPAPAPHKGDLVYLRIEEFMHYPDYPSKTGVWVVPEKDAQNLLKAGFVVQD